MSAPVREKGVSHRITTNIMLSNNYVLFIQPFSNLAGRKPETNVSDLETVHYKILEIFGIQSVGTARHQL